MYNMAYCDYISEVIQVALVKDSELAGTFVGTVDNIRWDLDREKGYMLSTKKMIPMTDVNGKKYMITIEEV